MAKAFAVSFKNPDKVIDYDRLLNVLRYSWAVHNPDIPLVVHETEPPEWKARKFGWDANTKKLEIWAANFDQDTIFLDCDMLCNGPMADGFDRIDHLGYTLREGANFILNGGVHYFKYTAKARAFMKEFVETNRRFIQDHYDNMDTPINDLEIWGPWHEKYDGMNQGAFGCVIEKYMAATAMPEIYNLCFPWNDWPGARMIHIKSNLRRQCLTGNDITPGHEGLVQYWRETEQKSKSSYNGFAVNKKKPTKKMQDDITVVMRSVEERTEQLCYNQLVEEIGESNVYILRNYSLSDSTRMLCNIATGAGRPWTLYTDADYIHRPGFLKDLHDIAIREDEMCMIVKGIIRCKFLMEHRRDNGGPMLQRTDILSRWLDIIDRVDNGVTTEPQCNRYFYQKGYFAHRSKNLVVLHDYEQYYHDIYRSCYIYGRKHKHLDAILPRWESMGEYDPDFKVALYAYMAGRNHEGDLKADLNMDLGFRESPFADWVKPDLDGTEVHKHPFEPYPGQIKP